MHDLLSEDDVVYDLSSLDECILEWRDHSLSSFLSLSATSLERILYRVLQRLIGLKSLTLCGLSSSSR
ncbi:hypothetical protein Scep_028633 [Stephania cephalantha]|uniref:Uncharacterized protein n=1 Tax=Stephania cephalantha TaxID=152367 RepID=A0AAP0HM95_9MAGN